jgi:hypothetical protein
MYASPFVLASFDAAQLLGPAYGGNHIMCGPRPGNGSEM